MNKCVVVLSYKERANLEKLLRSIVGEQIVCVIDGDDGSVGMAQWFAQHVDYSKDKRGYGNALKAGLNIASCLGYTHATVMDVGTCNPQYLDIEFSADILVRAREFDKLGIRAILSLAGAATLSLLTHELIRDATHGYRTYNLKSVIGLLPYLKSNGHATNMELLGLAIKAGRTVEYASVPYVLDASTQLRNTDIKEALKVALALMKGDYDCLTQAE